MSFLINPHIQLMPPPINGYSFWFRADGLVAGSANQYGIVSAGGAVSDMFDLGGGSISAQQTTGSKQPTLISGAIGTKLRKVVRFTAANLTEMDLLNALSLTNNIGALTIYSVHKINTGGATEVVVYFSVGTGTGARVAIISNLSDNNQINARRVDTDSASTLAANSSLTAKAVGGVFSWTNGDGFIYENASLINSNTSFTTSGNTTASDSQIAKLGSSGANYLDGDVGEVLVYLGAHDSTQIAQIHSWLNNFYGLY